MKFKTGLWRAAVAPLCGLALAFILGIVAEAADVGLELSPPMVDLVAESGAETSFTVLVGNTSNFQQVDLRVWLAPIEQKRNGTYRIREQAEKDQWSVLPWLQLEKQQLTLGPRGEGKVEVKVRVPRGAAGSRAGAVVFEVLPDRIDRQTGDVSGRTTFTHRLTTIVKLTVNSRANRRDAVLLGMEVVSGANDSRFASHGPRSLAVLCTLENRGNTLVSGRGKLLIRNSAGRRVHEGPLGGGRGVVLCGATVDFVTVFPAGLPEGDYVAEAMIHYGGSRPLQAKMPFTVEGQAAKAGPGQVAPTVQLGVTPDRVEARVPVGAFRGLAFTLANMDHGALRIKGMLKELGTDDNGELVPVEDAVERRSATGWLSLAQDSLVLAPGERKNLRLTVEVPKDATDGTRYASLVLEAEREDQPGVATAISTPVIIVTGKDLLKKAELEDAGIAMPEKDQVLLIGANFANQGNTHLTLTGGRVTLRRRGVVPTLSRGLEYIGEAKFEDVEIIPLELTGWVLPGTSRPVVVAYDRPLEPGEYQAEMVVEYGERLPARAVITFMAAPKGTDVNQLPATTK